MRCPVDAAELMMTERQGIEIDYCPTCRGVWLDRGELDKIIERTAQPVAAQSALEAATGEYRPDHHDPRYQPRYPDPARRPDDDDRRYEQRGYDGRGYDGQRGYDPRGYDPRSAAPPYGKRKKKKDFLEDLFDF